MLMSWIKTLPISANRFGLLYRALQAIGRTDLAIDLCSQSDRVTPEYLQQLAKLLQNDTWRRLGTALELSRGRLQAISGRTPGTSEEQACAMLMSWIKTLPISANRFGLLYRALQAIGRTDLAIDLCSQSGYDDSDETGQNQ
ncbi:hypothetical protein AHF37_12174 [Paragonimus kellicotti]|nr:hypothetical protein AHF37_12174 [Paragonimus kellicotti]